jgi:hypothetical protein
MRIMEIINARSHMRIREILNAISLLLTVRSSSSKEVCQVCSVSDEN